MSKCSSVHNEVDNKVPSFLKNVRKGKMSRGAREVDLVVKYLPCKLENISNLCKKPYIMTCAFITADGKMGEEDRGTQISWAC